MSTPDFDQIANTLIEEGAVAFSPSELHGVLVGQLAAGSRLEGAALNQFVASQLDLEKLSTPSGIANIETLYKTAIEQMESEDFELRILLPDDEHELAQRAEQLGSWVAGFLAGFGLSVGDKGQQLSSDAQDGLRDLVQIAQIEADGSEEDENLLMEVEEYVRMAAMLLFAECNVAPVAEAEKPTVH